MKSLWIYSIAEVPLMRIAKHFDVMYGFKVSRSSALKYVIKNIDPRLMSRGHFSSVRFGTERVKVSVDEETYHLYHKLLVDSGCSSYLPEVVLTVFVVRLAKLLCDSGPPSSAEQTDVHS